MEVQLSTKGGSPRRNGPRPVAFCMGTYLTAMVTDLAPNLGVETTGLLIQALVDSTQFKRLVGDLLDDAECMSDVGRYAALRQLEACFKKLSAYGAATATERKQRALSKFFESEKRCKRVNKRLSHYSMHMRRLSPSLRQVFSQAQHEISCMLGPVDHVFDTMMGQCGFGPGLTYALPHDKRNLVYKIGGDQTVTPKAKLLALEVLKAHFPHWSQLLADDGYCLTTVLGNRVTTVPKTAEIDRTIGIEPSLNVLLQKGVDEYLKHRLRALGLRLDSQDYSIDVIKRYNARVSTIDLSSASDSVSIELVKWLLPSDWYELLDTLRSHYYTVDSGKSWTRYEKFSSMGNATTFPLESLIFMAIARACALYCGFSNESIRDLVRVYGDDIIVPWECAALVIEALRFAGFSTNSDKTFVFGPFRETCGVDLLDGVDVRPVYTRAIPTKPWQVAQLYNRMLCNRFGFRFSQVCKYLWSLVDNPLTGPAYLGSSALEPRDFGHWYAGKCSEGDAYFFAPHSYHAPVYAKHDKYGNTTGYVCRKRWAVIRRRKIDNISERTLYLAFLLGLEGGEAVGDPIIGVVEDVSVFRPYPPLDRCWPDCYAIQREASDRIIRSVLQAVIGERVAKT